MISGRRTEDGDDEDVCAWLHIALCSPVGLRTVLLSHVNGLGCHWLQETTALSQHPSVDTELASHTPRNLMTSNPCFNFNLSIELFH